MRARARAHIRIYTYIHTRLTSSHSFLWSLSLSLPQFVSQCRRPSLSSQKPAPPLLPLSPSKRACGGGLPPTAMRGSPDPAVRMVVGRVQSGYPQISCPQVSVLDPNMCPQIFRFGYPKSNGFGADLNLYPWIHHRVQETRPSCHGCLSSPRDVMPQTVCANASLIGTFIESFMH